jgi:hypothetical protein
MASTLTQHGFSHTSTFALLPCAEEGWLPIEADVSGWFYFYN